MSGYDPIDLPAKVQTEGELAPAGEARPRLASEFRHFSRSAAATLRAQNIAHMLPTDGSTLRPQFSQLEQRCRECIGTRYAIPVTSFTAALSIPLIALGVGSGDEVIMSPLGVCALANIVVRLGAIPVLADADTDYNINPEEIERHITPRTRAIFATHYGGQPCRMDKILTYGEKRGLPVIEDGSQALGSTYRGRRVGAIGDVAAFCVHVRTRSMALRAGIITTNHQGLAETMQALSSTGEDAWLEDDADPVAQVMSCANIPGRIDSDLAVCTIPDLRRLDGLLKIRRRYARMYSSRLKNVAAFSVPFVWPDVRHAWQVYALTLHRERLALDYDGFVEALRGENIQVKAHSLPVHLHPDYRLASELRRGELPVAERLAGSSILLPLTEIMTERDVRGVIAALERVAARYRLQARE